MEEGESSFFPFLSEVKGELSPDAVKQSEDGTVFSFLDQPVAAEFPLTGKPSIPEHLTHVQEKYTTGPASPDSTSGILDTLSSIELRDPVAGKVTKTPQKMAVTSEKKKKRKAIRPGQGANKEHLEPAVTKEVEPAATVTKEWEPTVTKEWEPAVTVAKEQEPAVIEQGPTKEQEPAVAREQEPTNVVTKDQKPAKERELAAKADSGVNVLSAMISMRHPSPTPSLEQETTSAREFPPSVLPPASGHSVSPTFPNENLPSSNSLKEESTGKSKTLPERTCERVPLDTELMEGVPLSAGVEGDDQTSTSGNYIVQFTHEESLAGLLQSYASGLSKVR